MPPTTTDPRPERQEQVGKESFLLREELNGFELEEKPRGRRRLWTVIVLAIIALFGLALLRALLSKGEAVDRRQDGRPTPVRVAQVEVGSLALYGRYSGELVGQVVDLASKVSGRVEEVRVRPGERVLAGQILATLDDSDLLRELERERGQLEVARATRVRAAANLEEAEAVYRRGEILFAEGLLSRQDYGQLQAWAATARADLAAAQAQIEQAQARVALLEQQVAETRIRAPFTGVVASRYVDPGALVSPSTPVVRLVQEGSLLVQLRVPERDLAHIRPGVPLTVTTQATGETRFPGQVLRVSGEVGRMDRAALVEGSLDDPDQILRPGMYAEVEVRLREIDNALLVPGPAVVERVDPDGTPTMGVFTVAGREGPARWRPVKVLGQEGERVAVEGEINPEEQILILGHEELSDGSRVKVVETGFFAGRS